MNTSFQDLGISPPILEAIQEMGFELPTEVQNHVIPHILKQADMIVRSKTGSGKTAAFGIPMLQLIDPLAEGPQGLILTPTRELAVQVDSDLRLLSRHLPVKTAVVYGQHSMNVEITALKKGASIVTGTPGRAFDHIRQGNLVTKHVRFLVLDEADRMLDMGFIDQVMRIIRTLPKNRVTLLFSATMPTEIQRICREYMKNPVTVEIESDTMTVDSIRQLYYRVDIHEKRMQLHRLLTVEQPDSCMIFCNTRIAVDRVHEFLTRKGYACQALHGDIHQSKRLKTIQQFKNGEFNFLVATDVAARGLHIDDLSLVINYDVPNEKDSYVHRIGRTGRAGNGGRAITMVTSEDIMSLYEIEEHIGAMIAEEDLPTEAAVQACKAGAAEKWAQAKAKFRKDHPGAEPALQASAPRVSKTTERKPQHRKPASGAGNTPKQPPRPRIQQPVKGEALKPAAPAPAEIRQESLKPVSKPAAKPAPAPAPTPAPTPLQQQSQAPAVKKPLLQRLIGRILGK